MKLPKFELYETGSQIRRSSKSIRANIVEGYGRRRSKNDFIKFLIYAHASIDEIRDHLETLFETNSLNDKKIFNSLSADLDELGRKLYRFIQAVESSHQNKKRFEKLLILIVQTFTPTTPNILHPHLETCNLHLVSILDFQS